MAKTEKQPAVAFYGKVRIPQIGHKKAIDTAKSIASENGGRTYIGLSGTSHPLTSAQKKAHAEALFQHPVMTGDEHTKNLFSFLSHLNKHHDEVHLVAGSDRAPEYEKTMREWNGRKDSKGNVPFHFKKWKVHQVEGKRMDSPKHPTQMNRDELEKTVSATKVEGLAHKGDYPGFKAYHPDMPEEHVKRVYNQIRSAGPKPVATVKAKLKEQINQYNEELNHKHFGPMLDSFVSFASDKLGLKSMPNIQLQRKDEQGDQPSFGGYNPVTNCIVVITKDRHPMDIFRTVAHELVHQKQKQEDRIGKNIEQEGATGSDIENEANAEAGKLMRWYAKANPDHFKLSHMTEETLNEGIFDPATHTAVFLAGGPGSGKDFVMNRTLKGHGLTEINSDNAFNYLMNKHGLDPRMPENEKAERNLLRGRAKNIAREQQRLALVGRKGVIINGTAHDPEKLATIKGQLENLGYKTMMVYVHATDKVSRERNYLRGILAGPDQRVVSEPIRSEKWHASKKAMPKYKKMFGDENFIHVDNSDDYNLLPPEQKAAKDNEHNEIFKRVRQFTSTPVETPQAKAWEVSELSRRGIKTFNKTNPITRSARLQQIQEDLRKWFSKTDPEGGWKRINAKGEAIGPCAREPGEAKPKCMSNEKRAMLTKKERASAVAAKRRHDPNPERKGKPINVSNFGKGKISEASAAAIAAATAIAKKKSGNYDKEGLRIKPYKNPDAPNLKSNEERRKEMREQYLEEKNVPTNPELWSRAKALAKQKFDVYPSAYANGWASKWYKSKGGGWKSKVDEACWEDYKQAGMKKKGSKMVPNCVPVEEDNRETGIDADFKKFFEEVLPPSPGNTYGPSVGIGGAGALVKDKDKNKPKLPADSLGDTAPTATMAAGGGVTGGGYSIPMTSMSESVKRWIENPKTQERFTAKYGNLAEQKLMDMAQRLSKLPHSINIKPKYVTEFTSGDVALVNDPIIGSASKGKDTAFDTYGIYSGRGGVSGDREVMDETKTPKWKQLGYRGPGSMKMAQAFQKEMKKHKKPEEKKEEPKKMDEDALEMMPPRYKERLKDVSRYPGEISNVIRSRKQKAHISKEYHRNRMVGGGKESRAMRHMEESTPAWQRKEGKNPEGGLNKAGIASYRREHPGSKLSLAVTTKPSKLKKGSKRWKRRKSFCARMSGVKGPMKDEKGRPTRKALALRKWNCEE